ncbi:mucin-19-like [Candoia aspera]|uniref:mucin-19-like n=1 Tax=Candoia aspera TaxID=51853 RepID=UPI002FD7A1A8
MQSQAANGLECYSCVDEEGAGAGCANQTISKVQCTGIHSMCLEGIGNSRKAGKDVSLVTFKGCASPAMCQSSLLALVQELDNTDIICCQGNLCNDRIVDGVITQPRVPADSPEYFEEVGCAALSPTPSGPRPNLDCFYSNEVEDGNMVAHSPTGEVPSPKNHTDEETVYIADEKEASENFVNESNARPSSHHDHTIAGGNPYEENLLGDSSESNGTTPTGVSNSEHGSSGSSSAIMNLDTSNSSARPTSSGHHSGVAVLIPFIIPKRNTTTTATTSSALETSVSKEVLAASGNENDVESEECEAEEEDIATGKHFVAASANDHEDSPSTHLASSFHESGTPQNTSSSAEDTPNASVFVREGNSDESESYSSSTENTHNVSVLTAEEHGSPHFPVTDTSGSTSREGDHGATGGESAVVDNSIPVSAPTSNGATSDGIASYILPIPPITSQDNSFFLTEGTGKADASAAANTNVTNSINSPGMGLVAGAGTSRPKTKIPCKRPGSQNPPGVNRVSSSGTGSPGTEEDTVRNASTSFYSNAKSPERNAAGKVNPASGAVGLTSNVGLFSLTLLLAALTCLVC